MPRSALESPRVDPTPIFELFRGSYATELLTAAVCHFSIFARLAESPRTRNELAEEAGLAPRPAVVLTTALLAMKLLEQSDDGRLHLSDLAREHLLPGGDFDVGGYVGLAAQSPGVAAMVDSLKNDRPIPFAGGTVYTFRDGVASAMDESESARHFTLALAGRAKNVAPHLSRAIDFSNARTLLDVGGGSGIYSIACLQRHPRLRAIVFDRAEVLKTARELADEYGVGDRLECVSGDMFADPFPKADVALLSNVLHDWDVADCVRLVQKSAVCPRLVVHDVFLNDALDGPLPQSLYSAALFTLTEGRLYSAREVAGWMSAAGFTPGPPRPTLVHCAVMEGVGGLKNEG